MDCQVSIERLEAFFDTADQLDAADAESGAYAAGTFSAPGSPGGSSASSNATVNMDDVTRKLSFSAGLARAHEPVCALPNGSVELAGLSVGWGDAKAGEQGNDPSLLSDSPFLPVF